MLKLGRIVFYLDILTSSTQTVLSVLQIWRSELSIVQFKTEWKQAMLYRSWIYFVLGSPVPPPPSQERYKVHCHLHVTWLNVTRSFCIQKKNTSRDSCLVFSNDDLKTFPCQILKYGNSAISSSSNSYKPSPPPFFTPSSPQLFRWGHWLQIPHLCSWDARPTRQVLTSLSSLGPVLPQDINRWSRALQNPSSFRSSPSVQRSTHFRQRQVS